MKYTEMMKLALESRVMRYERESEKDSAYTEIKDLFERYITGAEIYEKQEDCVDVEFLARRKRKRMFQFYTALDKVCDYIQYKHGDELYSSGVYYPKRWMLNDQSVCDIMRRYRLVDVLNYLDKSCLDPKDRKTKELNKILESQQLSYKSNEHLHPYALILVNEKYYNQAEKGLGLRKITIQKYMQELCRIGALKRLTKIRTSYIYADGYYVDWDGKPTKKRFLKQEMKAELKTFKLG